MNTKYIVVRSIKRPDWIMYFILHYAPETSVTGAPYFGRPQYIRTLGLDGVD